MGGVVYAIKKSPTGDFLCVYFELSHYRLMIFTVAVV